MTGLTASGFRKLLTSQKRDHNNGLKCTEKALATNDQEGKERLTEMAGLYFRSAQEKSNKLLEYAKEESEGSI